MLLTVLILSVALAIVLARRETFRQWRRENRRQRARRMRPSLMNDGFGVRLLANPPGNGQDRRRAIRADWRDAFRACQWRAGGAR